PFRFTDRMRSKAASSSRCAGPSPPPMPTLLTRMSSRPKRALASSTIFWQPPALVMSPASASAAPPEPALAAPVSSSHATHRPRHPPVGAEHLRALAGDQFGLRVAVADGLGPRLPGAHDDRELA